MNVNNLPETAMRKYQPVVIRPESRGGIYNHNALRCGHSCSWCGLYYHAYYFVLEGVVVCSPRCKYEMTMAKSLPNTQNQPPETS